MQTQSDLVVSIENAVPWRSEVNVPLLRKCLEHITEHPEEWSQAEWAIQSACGTRCCLAGTAVTLAGYEIDWHDVDDEVNVAGYVKTDDPLLAETGAVHIAEAATRELNLPDWAAARLFHGGNDLADLWQLASEYTGGAIEIPERFRDAPKPDRVLPL